MLRITNEAGETWEDPSESLLLIMLQELGVGNTFLIAERLDGESARSTGAYLRVRRRARGTFALERAAGPQHGEHPAHREVRSTAPDVDAAHDVLTRWAFRLGGWDDPAAWSAPSEEPDAVSTLSFSSVHGGPSPAHEIVDAAIRRVVPLLRGEAGAAGVGGGSLDVQFHVPGPLLGNEFSGARTGRLSRRLRILVVQVAVPDHPPATAQEAESFVLGAVRRAVLLAGPRFARAAIPFPAAEFLARIDEAQRSLNSPDQPRTAFGAGSAD